MKWIYHDSYVTQKAAKNYGASIVELGLAKGIKVTKVNEVSGRPYSLYIIPLEEKAC